MGRKQIIITFMLIICMSILTIQANKIEKQKLILQSVKIDSVTLQGHIDKLNTENTRLIAQLYELTAQVRLLQENKQDKTDRGEPRGTRRIMEVTAYDLSYESCGKLPNHPEYGITASGEPVKEWYTVAAGKELKFGTRVYIPYFADKPNGGVFVVQDRGGGVGNGQLDVYMKTAKECFEFGRVYGMGVVVVEREGIYK